MICYEDTHPVWVIFKCKHEMCGNCFVQMKKYNELENCPKCRRRIIIEGGRIERLSPFLKYDKDSLQKQFPIICTSKNPALIGDYIAHAKLKINELGLQYALPISCCTSVATVKYMLKNGAKLQTEDSSVLHALGMIATKEVCEFVLNKNLDVNAENLLGETPLMVATIAKNVEIIRLLIKSNKVNCEIDNNVNWTPLQYACYAGDIEIVKILVHEGKANVNHYQPTGFTPLYLASSQGNLDIVIFLLTETKAKITIGKVTIHGWTVLQYTSCKGFIDIVRMLVQDGKANVNHCQENGESPLYLAAGNGKSDVVHFLLNETNAKNILEKETKDGWTVLQIGALRGYVEAVKLLVQDGKANVHHCQPSGESPLFVACAEGRTNVVEYLIKETEAKHLIEKETDKNTTVLQLACSLGYVDIVKILVEEGKANLKHYDKIEDSPLMLACKSENTELVEFLLTETDVSDIIEKMKINGLLALYRLLCKIKMKIDFN